MFEFNLWKMNSDPVTCIVFSEPQSFFLIHPFDFCGCSSKGQFFLIYLQTGDLCLLFDVFDLILSPGFSYTSEKGYMGLSPTLYHI